jgi:hypothetical protein
MMVLPSYFSGNSNTPKIFKLPLHALFRTEFVSIFLGLFLNCRKRFADITVTSAPVSYNHSDDMPLQEILRKGLLVVFIASIFKTLILHTVSSKCVYVRHSLRGVVVPVTSLNGCSSAGGIQWRCIHLESLGGLAVVPPVL